jgi:hypothetical protein
VGPRDSGYSRSTTVPSGQLNLKLISCYRPWWGRWSVYGMQEVRGSYPLVPLPQARGTFPIPALTARHAQRMTSGARSEDKATIARAAPGLFESDPSGMR